MVAAQLMDERRLQGMEGIPLSPTSQQLLIPLWAILYIEFMQYSFQFHCDIAAGDVIWC